MQHTRPNSRRNLDLAIERLADGREDALRVRRLLANTVVAQMLPEGVVKGGGGMRLRFGTAATRYSADLDTARMIPLESFIAELSKNLERGWGGFTGRIVEKAPAHPRNVPPEYVMQPYDVKLDYNGKPWTTVELEVGHNEIGDAEDPDYGISDEVIRLFRSLKLDEPGPIPLMSLAHQVAQKLHGASAPGSERAHDLVDLQVIVSEGSLDLTKTRAACVRLFAYRGAQEWPPVIVEQDRWAELYDAARGGLPVLPTSADAVRWANDLIEKINKAGDGMPGC